MTDENTRLPEGLELLLRKGVELQLSNTDAIRVKGDRVVRICPDSGVLGCTSAPLGLAGSYHSSSVTGHYESSVFIFLDGTNFTIHRTPIGFENFDLVSSNDYMARVREVREAEANGYDIRTLSAFVASSDADPVFSSVNLLAGPDSLRWCRENIDSETGFLHPDYGISLAKLIVDHPSLRGAYHAYAMKTGLPVRGDEE
jgi:hypothetical protein